MNSEKEKEDGHQRRDNNHQKESAQILTYTRLSMSALQKKSYLIHKFIAAPLNMLNTL